eukprot:5714076-Amphidinium_carterae.1
MPTAQPLGTVFKTTSLSAQLCTGGMETCSFQHPVACAVWDDAAQLWPSEYVHFLVVVLLFVFATLLWKRQPEMERVCELSS